MLSCHCYVMVKWKRATFVLRLHSLKQRFPTFLVVRTTNFVKKIVEVH